MANGDGYIVWYNRRWHEYCGTTPEEMEGWGWQAVHDQDLLPGVMERWTSSVATGEPFEMTFPLRGADGVFRPFLTRIHPVRDDTGQVVRWFGVNTEISAQVRAEAELARREAHLAAFFEQSAAGMSEADATGRFLRVNDRFCAITGRSRAELLTLRMHDITHQEDLPGNAPLFARTAETGKPFEIEKRYLRPDGSTVWVHNSVTTLRDADGRLLNTVCVTVDITDRKRAEDDLRELNKTLERRVAEATAERDRIWAVSQDLLGVASFEGYFVNANPAWEAVLGWSADELRSIPFMDLVHPDDRATTTDEMSRLAQGARTLRFENRYRAKSGDHRWLSWTAVPEGELIYCVARDVTAEREAAAELERAQEALRQSQKMEAVGQLTGGVAHDFNNMLAVVIGSLDLLGRRIGTADVRARRYLDAAGDGARRAALLTQRLLAFSRQQPLRPEPVDVNRLVAGISDLLRHSLGGDVRLETVLAGGLWRSFADPNQLENAILNLAVNARDAMPEGGRLTVETQNAHLDERYAAAHPGVPSGQYVLVAVTDTGVGMSPEVVAKAFDPFFTTKEVGKGTGLGLSQVYGFVKQSGGHVKIYSELGQGTTVKIYLPRFVGEGPERAEGNGPDDVPLGEQQEIVLVVEDEPAVRQFSVDALSELGYRVLEADSAGAALRLLDMHPEVSLLFTDVVMPEVNGRKLADEARRRRPDLKVLFTTGYSRNAVVHNGILDPGVELIGKPFTVEELAAKIRAVLDHPTTDAIS